MLVSYWDPKDDCFMIDQMPLRVKIEDIYFIIGLSRRGEPVNFQHKATGGLNVEDYIRVYYAEGTQKIRTQTPIRDVQGLHMKILIFAIFIVVRSTSLHQDS